MDGLSVGFENCEVLTVPEEYIGAFHLDGIENLHSMDGCALKNYQAGQIILSLDRGLRGFKMKGELFAECLGKESDYIARMQSSCSISSFRRILGGAEEAVYYWCPWGDDDDHVNAFQQSKMNRHGDLFITIGRDAALLDKWFPDETINADDYNVPCVASAKRQQAEERAKRMPRKTVFARFKEWVKNIRRAWYSIRKGAGG